LAFLRLVGCDTGQGYFWSRALPATELTQWLGEHHRHPATGGASSEKVNTAASPAGKGARPFLPTELCGNGHCT
jgi:hypothetical protein